MKSLSFFQRRKILKKVNYLDLTPLRRMEFDVLSDGKVDILMPRFRHPALKRILQPNWKQEVIRIHLDEIGSAIWLYIDGSLKVNEVCSRLQAAYPEKLQPQDETEKRVTQFLSLLYQEKYISFKEIIIEKMEEPGK